ncbi:hypothetical protein BKA93DRAFT_829249 [Sparassis latifolia]|uniref:Uncharacterized protein n=1 Tax=Sparassis crispa TaxID=139825 RepID=A0A401H6T9_9APHY|nr:hypothetical protein SCP_1900050 [Sparassis crispa]GBE90156.1 hypothetical protein SCP_1900050 [Sparassis crispa]
MPHAVFSVVLVLKYSMTPRKSSCARCSCTISKSSRLGRCSSYPVEVLLTFDAQPLAGAAALVACSMETLHVLHLAWCPLGAFANLTWLAIHTLQMDRPADMGVLGVFPMLRTLTL